MTGRFINTCTLVKSYLKREWKISLVWGFIAIFLSLMVLVLFADMYPTTESLIGMAETMKNPAMIAMVGPLYGEVTTVPILFAQTMVTFMAIILSLMNIFLVVRYTRRDEENGCLELIRSRPVGKLSNLTATMIICVIINAIITLITGLGLFSLGIDGINLNSSMLYASTIGITGLAFAGITAIFAQACATAKGAVVYSGITLAIVYILRMIGDISIPALSYISQLGLVFKAEPFYSNNWWPILIVLVQAIIFTTIAFRLNMIRDLGAGFIPAKPGKREAKKLLGTPFGLALRLSKGTIIGWTIAMFLAGITYGSVFGDIEKFVEGNEMIQQMFLNDATTSMAESFLSTLLIIAAVMITVPVINLFLRLRKEEQKGRIESIYAKKVKRSTFMVCFLIIAILASILFSLAFAIGLYLAQAPVMEIPIPFMTVLNAGLAYLPAIWAMLGIVTVLLAFIPKTTGIIWGYLGISGFILYIGRGLGLPEWLFKLTTYGHIARVPIEEINWVSLIILAFISLMLFTAGIIGYKKRDIKQF